MSRLRFHISISLDGYVAGPNQSEDDPFGGRGPWGDDPWMGWWGDDPPFRLEPAGVIEAPGVAHLNYRVVR